MRIDKRLVDGRMSEVVLLELPRGILKEYPVYSDISSSKLESLQSLAAVMPAKWWTGRDRVNKHAPTG